MTEAVPRVVIDTNVVLDLLVFKDPACALLSQALQQGALEWVGTEAMGQELKRVLDYPKIARRREFYGMSVVEVMTALAQRVTRVPAAPRAPNVCKDPDDQMYVDLAVAHHATLLSKDGAVLALRRRLADHGVQVVAQWPARARPAPPGVENTGPVGATNHYSSGRGDDRARRVAAVGAGVPRSSTSST